MNYSVRLKEQKHFEPACRTGLINRHNKAWQSLESQAETHAINCLAGFVIHRTFEWHMHVHVGLL
jgi:hypothetical protein